jgi:glycerol-3-phosphate dehydrogenase (NAD(P)+)
MKICVLGAGSWGIALAIHLKRAGHQPTLWAYKADQAAQLSETRENQTLLPGAVLPADVLITHNLNDALTGAEGVVMAAPSQSVRSTCWEASPFIDRGTWVVCAAKGLEENTHLRMSEVLKQNLTNNPPIAVLSGPSHAEEVLKKMPTTVVAASLDAETAASVQTAFHSDYFRVYTSDDLIGVELGGALKNVIAIAAGITDGLGLGDNAKAALMTRGLHEITRLGVSLGAQPLTFAGLAGMGDLIVTCTSRHSRNRLLGEKLGKGASLETALGEMVMVAEGVKTAKSALDLAKKVNVEVPIIEEVNQVLFEGKKAKEALRSLLSRSAKSEKDFEL